MYVYNPSTGQYESSRLGAHAVVAYGYREDADGKFYSRVHYGWPGGVYMDVRLVGVNWRCYNVIELL